MMTPTEIAEFVKEQRKLCETANNPALDIEDDASNEAAFTLAGSSMPRALDIIEQQATENEKLREQNFRWASEIQGCVDGLRCECNRGLAAELTHLHAIKEAAEAWLEWHEGDDGSLSSTAESVATEQTIELLRKILTGRVPEGGGK